LIGIGEERKSKVSDRGDTEGGLDCRSDDGERREADETERRVKPNFLLLLGGRGGGESSKDLLV
jgi:hypothetical protein